MKSDDGRTATVDRSEGRMPLDEAHDEHDAGRESPPAAPRVREGGGWFRQYKPEQGRATRVGTVVGGGLLAAWGSYFLYERLSIFEGDEAWRLLVSYGIPMVFGAGLFALVWWFAFVLRSSSDFMIATESEMKKVSWSTRKEIIGSTKVVVLFTFLLAVFLFLVDVVCQLFFSAIGVLKR